MYKQLATFEELGHIKDYSWKLTDGRPTCSRCVGCTEDSIAGGFPCRDELGITVRRVKSIRDGKYAVDFIWRRKLIGYQIIDCC